MSEDETYYTQCYVDDLKAVINELRDGLKELGRKHKELKDELQWYKDNEGNERC